MNPETTKQLEKLQALEPTLLEAFKVASEEYKIQKGLTSTFVWREGRTPPKCGLIGAVILWRYASQVSETGERHLSGNLVFNKILFPIYQEAVAEVLGINLHAVRRLVEGFEGLPYGELSDPLELPEELIGYSIGQSLAKQYG